mgnify:CR=1 FL=1
MVRGTKSGKSGAKGGYAILKAKLKKKEEELEEKGKALGEKGQELEKVKKEPASQPALGSPVLEEVSMHRFVLQRAL